MSDSDDDVFALISERGADHRPASPPIAAILPADTVYDDDDAPIVPAVPPLEVGGYRRTTNGVGIQTPLQFGIGSDIPEYGVNFYMVWEYSAQFAGSSMLTESAYALRTLLVSSATAKVSPEPDSFCKQRADKRHWELLSAESYNATMILVIYSSIFKKLFWHECKILYVI